MSVQILQVIQFCASKGPMHCMAKQDVLSVLWDSVAYSLMSFLLLVLMGGILQRGILLALLVLLGTTVLLLLLLMHLFDVLMDTMLIAMEVLCVKDALPVTNVPILPSFRSHVHLVIFLAVKLLLAAQWYICA